MTSLGGFPLEETGSQDNEGDLRSSPVQTSQSRMSSEVRPNDSGLVLKPLWMEPTQALASLSAD